VVVVEPGSLRRIRRIVGFWLVRLWGPGWDGRRRQLFLHYCAYFRNPQIPAEYLPDSCRPDACDRQIEFSSAFMKKIRIALGSAVKQDGVFLTYLPLAKNLRLLGTAVCRSVDRKRGLFIEPEGTPHERRRLQRRGYEWSPWLWARSETGTSEKLGNAALAWNEFFENPPANRPHGQPETEERLPVLGLGEGPFSARYLKRVLKVAVATRYVFAPAPSITAEVGRWKDVIGWPAFPRRVLGMHVRRGDAASVEADGAHPRQSNRRSMALFSYLEVADRMCEKYGIRDIFLATESSEEIETAVRARPQYRFLWLEYDRSLFLKIGASRHLKNIEDLVLAHPERARPLALSAILDLCLFCECDAFVGTLNSEFSVLAWLLMIGSRGHLVPYVSLSKAETRRGLDHLNPGRTRTENCPLELYRW